MTNFPLIGAAIVVGAVLAWWSGKRVAMTDMPQMIALYNGMGGGAAAAIAAVELYRGGADGYAAATLAVVGGLIGAVSFSGSAIAFGKLQGLIKRSFRFRGQQVLNILLLAAALVQAVLLAGHFNDSPHVVTALFVLALILGVTMTLPIGGADMPVVISLYNALTGLAVGLEGFVLHNAAMIVAGTVVGSAGTLLTQLMARAMNRSLANVLFSGFGDTGRGRAGTVTGSIKPIEASDVGVMLAFAQKVISGARLRHGGRPGAAQDLGAVPAAHRSRRDREIRDPSGRRPHAGAHERAARGSRRTVRSDRRPR